ncbi:MAG: hypothetical protein WCY86_02545 [Spirosomataceae bacterium]
MAVNVPYQDDFDGLLEPVLFIHQNDPTFSEWWQALFTQDDERRIVVDRLAAYVSYLISGHINLRGLILVGTLNLLLLGWVFYRWFRSTKTPWVLGLAIPWVLFNIQYYETIFWSMIPFQHLSAFIWGILTMWLLSRNTKRTYIAALIFGVLTLFSDVSGAFTLGSGGLILVAQHRWKELLLWVIIMGAFILYYFTGLVIPEYRPKFSDNFSNPLLLISIFTALFGIWADLGPQTPVLLRESMSVLLGILTIALIAYFLYKTIISLLQTKKPLHKDDAFIWGAIAFVAVVLATLAIGRASEGMESIFKPRYRHMYVFWLLLVYILSIRNLPQLFSQGKVQITTLVISVLFCFNAYMSYWGELDQFRKTLLADAYQWYHNRSLPSSPIYLSLRDRVDTIYEGVYNEGIYRPESYPFAKLPTAPVEGNVDIILDQHDGNVEVEVVNFKRGGGKDDGAYVLFKAANGETHILPAYQSVRPPHRILLEKNYYYPGGRIARYGTAYFQSDVFDIEIGVIEGDRQYRLITGKQLRL